jgi:hypothetical protein
VNDPVTDVLLVIILGCIPALILLVPRDPFVRQWAARRHIRRLRNVRR